MKCKLDYFPSISTTKLNISVGNSFILKYLFHMFIAIYPREVSDAYFFVPALEYCPMSSLTTYFVKQQFKGLSVHVGFNV